MRRRGATADKRWFSGAFCGRDRSPGGLDFLRRLFSYLGETYVAAADPKRWAALPGEDTPDPPARAERARLHQAVNVLREGLTTQQKLWCRLPGVPHPVVVAVEEYNDLIREPIEQTVDVLEETIARAGVAPQHVSAIYRIGGAARIPLVGVSLCRLNVPVHLAADPELVVAQGAALPAGDTVTAAPKAAADRWL